MCVDDRFLRPTNELRLADRRWNDDDKKQLMELENKKAKFKTKRGHKDKGVISDSKKTPTQI